jgi:hypothetical protein
MNGSQPGDFIYRPDMSADDIPAERVGLGDLGLNKAPRPTEYTRVPVASYPLFPPSHSMPAIRPDRFWRGRPRWLDEVGARPDRAVWSERQVCPSPGRASVGAGRGRRGATPPRRNNASAPERPPGLKWRRRLCNKGAPMPFCCTNAKSGFSSAGPEARLTWVLARACNLTRVKNQMSDFGMGRLLRLL